MDTAEVRGWGSNGTRCRGSTMASFSHDQEHEPLGLACQDVWTRDIA